MRPDLLPYPFFYPPQPTEPNPPVEATTRGGAARRIWGSVLRSSSFPLAALLVLGVVAALLPTAPAGAAGDQREPQLTFDVLFGEDTLGRQASDLRWSPDGERLAFRWDDGTGEALWILEPRADDAEPRRIFRPGDGDGNGEGEDAAAEEEDDGTAGLDAYHWSPEGDALLLEMGGDLHLLELGSRVDPGERAPRRLTDTEATEEEPAFSPDGTRVAFVRDWDLHLLELQSGEERALTEGGTENELLNGITDWVYWEEIWGRDSTGFWWSPDGARIAYYQFDETPVGRFPLVNFLPRYPEIEWQRYPKAGTDNPRVRIGVLELASGETTWLDAGDDPSGFVSEDYLARVHWHPGSDTLAVQKLERGQDRLEVLLCAAADGACEGLLTETHPTWVNLGHGVEWLPDGRFLWDSERSGWRQLYLYRGDGTLERQLTGELAEGTEAVASVDAVAEDGSWVVYTAHPTGGLGAARRGVYRRSLEPGDAGRTELAPAVGWHGARVAPATGLWVDGWSAANQPSRQVVRDQEGELLAELPSEPPVFDPEALPEWELLTLAGPDGVELPARRILPPGFDPEERYPVIMYHYGCPASQVVSDRWGGRGRDLWHKMMAERGYVILSVDNRASTFFGKAGEDRAHRRFGPGNLAAQKAGVEYLKAQPWVDPERIGLWGWSGGGSNTLYALLESPGTWRAGVAGAPVTDWRLYDTIWTERYLDHPDDNAEGYEASSPVTYADRLKDALLIVHGTADDNVHPQNTVVMSHALIEAGKSFEQAIHPRQKHGYRGKASRHFYERMTEFFERHLGAELTRPGPPG